MERDDGLDCADVVLEMVHLPRMTKVQKFKCGLYSELIFGVADFVTDLLFLFSIYTEDIGTNSDVMKWALLISSLLGIGMSVLAFEWGSNYGGSMTELETSRRHSVVIVVRNCVEDIPQLTLTIFIERRMMSRGESDGFSNFAILSMSLNVAMMLWSGRRWFSFSENGVAGRLVLASCKGHTESVRVLLEEGADVEAKNEYGRTALIMASCEGRTDIVAMLLKRGADANAKDKGGETALYRASENGHAEIVGMLLEKGADVNAKDKDGMTALIKASRYGRTKIVAILLQRGADVEANDKNGLTALFRASQNGHTNIVRLLQQYGAGKEALREARLAVYEPVTVTSH